MSVLDRTTWRPPAGGAGHPGAATAPPPRGRGLRTAAAGALLGAAGTFASVLFKLRCGMPADQAGQYLRWCYSDVPPLWFAERLDVGAVPYVDHAVEYPPLTGLWMWAAGQPATDAASFFGWTSLLIVAAAAVVGALLATTVGLRRTLVFAAAPTLVVSGVVNWDLPSMAFAVGGLVAHRRGRDGWAGALLGLGVSAKLWPLLLVPAVVLAAGALRGRRQAVVTAAAALGAWLAVNLPVLVVAPEGWARFLELSRERAADWDSLWRIVPGWLGTSMEVPLVNTLVGVVTALGCGALLLLALRWDPPARWHLVALPLVAWFLVAGKVWSPQFTLWLLPLFALAMPPVWMLGAVAVADVAVTLTRFPYLGTVAGVEGGWGPGPFEAAVVVRAVVVAVGAWWGWRRAATAPAHEVGVPSERERSGRAATSWAGASPAEPSPTPTPDTR